MIVHPAIYLASQLVFYLRVSTQLSFRLDIRLVTHLATHTSTLHVPDWLAWEGNI